MNEVKENYMRMRISNWTNRKVHDAKIEDGYWKALVLIDGYFNWFRVSDLLKIAKPKSSGHYIGLDRTQH